MSNYPASTFKGAVRVFMLLDNARPEDPRVHPQKQFVQITGFTDVSSTIDVEDTGHATIKLNELEYRYKKFMPFNELMTRQWGEEIINSERASTFTSDQSINLEYETDFSRTPVTLALMDKHEISVYQQLLKHYGHESEALNVISNLAAGNNYDLCGVLINAFSLQNLVWIEYLSKDGDWIRKFTGVLTSITESVKPDQTPELTLYFQTFDRFLEYSQVVTGLKNLGSSRATEIISTQGQQATISSVGRYSGKKFSEIVVDVFRVTNNFFLRQSDGKHDYRYYKVKDIFGFGQDLSTHVYDEVTRTYKYVKSDSTSDELQIGERGYPINSPKFSQKKIPFNQPIEISDYYPGIDAIITNSTTLEQTQASVHTSKELCEVVMAEEYYNDARPYQNLVRTHLGLFNTDKMSPKEILNEIKKTVLCYIYCDGDGTIKIERPYYDIHLGSDEMLPPDFDLRYVISTKDASFLSYEHESSESKIVTRVEMQGQQDFINDLGSDVNALIMQGFSNSSLKVISKFGERIVSLKAIPNQGFKMSDFKTDILNSYCFCQKLLFNTDSETISFTLKQRPDLQLNRPMMFLDRGITFLIHTLTESYNAKEGIHYTTVRGKYVRPVGFRLINPWRYLVRRDDDGPEPSWKLVSWDTQKVKPLQKQENNTIYGIGIPGSDILDVEKATYDTITAAMNAFGIDYSSGNITGMVYRTVRTGPEFMNGSDSFYFVWGTEATGTGYLACTGYGGDFKSRSQYSGAGINLFAKVKSGEKLTFTDNSITGYKGNGNATYQIRFCDKFKYQLCKPNADVSVDNKNSEKTTTVYTKTGRIEKLMVLLSDYFTDFYDDFGDDKTNPTKTAYNCLQLVFDKAPEVFNQMEANNQKTLDITIIDINNDLAKHPSDPGTVTTGVDQFICTLYALENGTYALNKDSKKRIESVDTPNYDDISASSVKGSLKSMLYCTKEFLSFNTSQFNTFLSNKSLQKENYKYILASLEDCLNDDSIVIDGLSIHERKNYILNNLSVTSESTNSISVAYDKSGSLAKTFPLTNEYLLYTNTNSALIALAWFGLKSAMRKYPSEDYVSLISNHYTDVLKYIRDYYLFRIWNEDFMTSLKKDKTKQLKFAGDGKKIWTYANGNKVISKVAPSDIVRIFKNVKL